MKIERRREVHFSVPVELASRQDLACDSTVDLRSISDPRPGLASSAICLLDSSEASITKFSTKTAPGQPHRRAHH